MFASPICSGVRPIAPVRSAPSNDLISPPRGTEESTDHALFGKGIVHLANPLRHGNAACRAHVRNLVINCQFEQRLDVRTSLFDSGVSATGFG